MKKTLLIGIILLILILSCGLNNKTFFKNYYQTTNNKGEIVKIPLPIFSYFKQEDANHNVTFKTLIGAKRVNQVISNYIEGLTACYNESYYYDENLGITIKQYLSKKGFPFSEIILSYDKGDYCTNQYVLPSNWLTIIKEEAIIKEVVIIKCNIQTNITFTEKPITNYDVKTLYDYSDNKLFKRIENKENIIYVDQDDSYVVNVYYQIKNEEYKLEIFSYNNNLVFKVIDSNDHAKNAIYEIEEPANQVLKQLWLFD